ncbi:MAG TPA: M4 family metallopeptidase, partial [Myxococcaceae bacterium]|nr:M4 family metallopeptidase [Myxococcaceae bacterium]
MRIRRLVSILPLMFLGSACAVEATDVDALDSHDELAMRQDGRGLQQLKAQRPEFFRGVGATALKRVNVDTRGAVHERLSQSIDNIPVFGGEAIIHLDENGAIASVTDRLVRNLRVDTTPRLRSDEALRIAVDHAGGYRALAGEPKSDLQILPERNGARLTWRVQLESVTDKDEPSMPVLFIDAHTGELFMQYDNLKTQRNRKTYTAKNRTSLPGTLVRSEGQGASGDDILDMAHDNAGYTYDFYFNMFGRDSYNGAGATLTSTVHYSRNYVNAFWNGSQMVYGDGDGSQSSALTVLDVVAHELTHAVTDFSSDLIYSNESGALNEAMSDIFGASIEAYRDGAVSANTWKIGEECWTPGTAGDALRYMNDPALAGDYDY